MYIGTLSTIESMHKGFVGSTISKGATAESTLVQQYRTTLLNACINMLASLSRLHILMGGGAHHHFILAVACIEVSAVLGLCLLSGSLVSTSNQGFGPELRQRCYVAFLDGLSCCMFWPNDLRLLRRVLDCYGSWMRGLRPARMRLRVDR